MHLVLEEMKLEHIPETKSWRLNERMYGKLQGEDKSEVKRRYGEKQVSFVYVGFVTSIKNYSINIFEFRM
jgi:bisphosphoglycerate-dependent phosphoglycerate mutase